MITTEIMNAEFKQNSSNSSFFYENEFMSYHEIDDNLNIFPQKIKSVNYLLSLFLAGTMFTVPIVYDDPLNEFRRSGSSSHSWVQRKRNRRIITMHEARLIALQIYEDTEKTLLEDYLRESLLLDYLWDEEE